jgi:menaquinone-dependent protoporphyrinogen oxidase
MPRLLILYGTHDGHTVRVARAACDAAREAGWDGDIRNCKHLPRDFSLEAYDAAIVAASVIAGRYQGYVRGAVRAHRAELAVIPTAFVSVSWSATKQAWAPPTQQRERANERFFRETGWRPRRVISVGGAILYTRHNWLARWVWSLFIRRAGGPSNLSRDYDFTDWDALRRETHQFLTALVNAPPVGP